MPVSASLIKGEVLLLRMIFLFALLHFAGQATKLLCSTRKTSHGIGWENNGPKTNELRHVGVRKLDGSEEP